MMRQKLIHSLQRRLTQGRRMPSFKLAPTPPHCRVVGGLHLQQSRCYSVSAPMHAKTIPITYIEPDGTEKEVQAEIGKDLLDVAHENNIELEGACGGELACSTCHLIFEKEMYDTLPEKEVEEDDMLDLAFEVTETSRLGCQIYVREDMAGMKVRIPDDGF